MGYTVVDDLMEVKGTDCFLMMMAWEPSQQDRIGVSREAAFRIVNGGRNEGGSDYINVGEAGLLFVDECC